MSDGVNMGEWANDLRYESLRVTTYVYRMYSYFRCYVLESLVVLQSPFEDQLLYF